MGGWFVWNIPWIGSFRMTRSNSNSMCLSPSPLSRKSLQEEFAKTASFQSIHEQKHNTQYSVLPDVDIGKNFSKTWLVCLTYVGSSLFKTWLVGLTIFGWGLMKQFGWMNAGQKGVHVPWLNWPESTYILKCSIILILVMTWDRKVLHVQTLNGIQCGETCNNWAHFKQP